MTKTTIWKSRIQWIDNAKAIGIILVIIGHAFRDEMRTNLILYDYIYSAIYFFHMPLFFTVSGFLLEKGFYRNESKLRMISKKIKTLFVPFVSYTLIIYFVFKIASLIPTIGNILSKGKGDINLFRYLFLSFLGDNPYSFHLWFLISLFIVEVISILLRTQKTVGGGVPTNYWNCTLPLAVEYVS